MPAIACSFDGVAKLDSERRNEEGAPTAMLASAQSSPSTEARHDVTHVVKGNCFDGDGIGVVSIVVDGDGDELLARLKF